MNNSINSELKSNPLKALSLICLLLLSGCMNYGDPVSYKSPDGSIIVDVVTEEQLSNDPDPFWQHVSIRNSNQYKPNLPGNILRVAAHKKPKIKWVGADTVSIEFSGVVGQSFNQEEMATKFYNDIFVLIEFAESIQVNDP